MTDLLDQYRRVRQRVERAHRDRLEDSHPTADESREDFV